MLRPAQVRLLTELNPSTGSVHLEPAVIDSVRVGGAADGSALATIEWRGNSGLPVAYLSSYSPVVGHVVLLLVQGPQVIIVGQIRGLTDGAADTEPDGLPNYT